jgi:hypothetical protein
MIAETEGLQRVRYVERGPLSAADLAAEQTARLSGRWLHQIAEHDWGIVVGLAIDLDQRGLTIQPGVAVDGYGRELVLTDPLDISWERWSDDSQPGQGEKNLFDLLGDEPDPDRRADLWLLWDRRPEYLPTPGRSPLGPCQHSRWLEIPRLRVLPAGSKVEPMPDPVPQGGQADAGLETPPAPDPRTPPGTDNSDAPTLLLADLTDDPALEWPVFLGRVKQIQREAGSFDYSLDSSIPRPYARLRGETITAASRLAQMQLSGGPGRSRFVVALPDAAAASEKSATFDAEPLAINEPGELVTRGETQLYGFAYQYPDGNQQIDKQGDLMIENRPAFDINDVGSATTLVQMLTNKTNPVAQEIYKKLSPTTQEKLQAINRGERIFGVNLRQLVATDLSTIVDTGLSGTIFNNLPLNFVGSLPGGVVSPVFRRRLPFVPRSINIPRPPLLVSHPAPIFVPPVAADDFAVDQGDAGESTSGNLTRQEVRALLEALFPGLLADSGGQEWGVTFQPLAQLPAEAAPWQVYHGVVKPEEPPQGAAAVQSAKEIHQLRIEIQNPGDTGDPRLYRFVIGRRLAEAQDEDDEAPADAVVDEPALIDETPIPFTECLIVQADGTVAMLGATLRVNGQVLEGPVQANPEDPRLAAVLVQGASRGVPSTTSLTAAVLYETATKKLQYKVTNNTLTQYYCNPIFQNIWTINSENKLVTKLRGQNFGGSFIIPASDSVTFDVETTDLVGKGLLSVKIDVTGADPAGYYAASHATKTIDIPS